MTDVHDDPAADIRAAERRAALAKERLTDTLGRLQVKLKPGNLAKDAAKSAADAGQNAARAAQRNPGPVAGAVAVTGLFLLRHRVAALFRRKKKKHFVPAHPQAPHTSDRRDDHD